MLPRVSLFQERIPFQILLTGFEGEAKISLEHKSSLVWTSVGATDIAWFLPGAAFPSVHSVRKSPMVEQAVQTGPLDNSLNPKKAVKAPPAIPRNTRQIQQNNKTNGTEIFSFRQYASVLN